MNDDSFDPSKYEDAGGSLREIPDGIHEFTVDEGGMKDWGGGERSANYKLLCSEEGLTDRWLFVSFGIFGADESKVKKNRTNLATFCRALGHDKPMKDLNQPLEILKRSVMGTVQTYNGKKSLLPWGFTPVGGWPVADAIRPHEDDLPNF